MLGLGGMNLKSQTHVVLASSVCDPTELDGVNRGFGLYSTLWKLFRVGWMDNGANQGRGRRRSSLRGSVSRFLVKLG